MSTTRTAATEFPDGVEWFARTRVDGTEEEDGQCARCGSSVAWEVCDRCGGDGYGEEIWSDIGVMARVPCDTCQGECGWFRCLSSPAFCEANPLPGREHVTSAAAE